MIDLICVSFSGVFGGIFYFLIALVLLMVMITIHELGHYIFGRIFKFKINEFSIGMGPKIFQKKRKTGELFSIRCIPLGGYCAFDGEDEKGENESNNQDLPDSKLNNDKNLKFNDHKPWKRIIVLFSGAFFNFVSAIIVALIVLACYGYQTTIMYVHTDTNAYQNQTLMKGDVIYKVNDKVVYMFTDARDYIMSSQSDEIKLVVQRNGEMKEVVIMRDEYSPDKLETTKNEDGAEYLKLDENGNVIVLEQASQPMTNGIGVVFNNQGSLKLNFPQSISWSLGYSFKMAGLILNSLGSIITGDVGIGEIGGPIALISATTQIASSGLYNTLVLVVMVSINLAVFNLLPIPALDGSRIVFVIIEWIRKKPINRNIEAIIHTIGLIVLFILVLGIDIWNLIF